MKLYREKNFECFSFTLYNLTELSNIVALPPNDTTEKDGKKGARREGMREGRRQGKRSHITKHMTIKNQWKFIIKNTGKKCSDLFTLL